MTTSRPNPLSLRPLALSAALAFVAACSPAGDAATAGNEATAGQAATREAPAATVPEAASPSSDALGHLTLRIDGETTTYETLPDLGAERPPSAVVRSMGPMRMLVLQAHLPGDPMKQATLSANFMDQGNGPQPSGQPELDAFPEGTRAGGLEATALEVEWDRIELGAEGGHVAGRFTGTLCPYEGASDTGADCRPVEGEFDTAVRAQAL